MMDSHIPDWSQVALLINAVDDGIEAGRLVTRVGRTSNRARRKAAREAVLALYDMLEGLAADLVLATANLRPRRCSNCDKEFIPQRATARWCPACARAFRAAEAMVQSR